jgi:eukaryotic-like serine/threonine-protein kinase
MGNAVRVEAAERRIGRTLSAKWRLTRLIAVGGMGAVYEANHRNGKRVAVKMLHPDIALDATQRRRLVREGYAANAIDHPGVVKIDDDDVDSDGSVFLVMELLDGESMQTMFDRSGGRLEPEQVMAFAERTLGILEVAHGVGIVHRDIKPANLFVTREGRMKLLDFGVARSIEPELDGGLTTLDGTLIGTPAFMAPEQARGRWDLVDGRTDVWSLGATMYRLLAGRIVHPAETRNELLGFAMSAAARSLAEAEPTLPHALIEVVDRALAYDPADRWKSAAEMRRALRVAMQGSGVPPVEYDTQDQLQSARARPPAAGPNERRSGFASDFPNSHSEAPTERNALTRNHSGEPWAMSRIGWIGLGAVGLVLTLISVRKSDETPKLSRASPTAARTVDPIDPTEPAHSAFAQQENAPRNADLPPLPSASSRRALPRPGLARRAPERVRPQLGTAVHSAQSVDPLDRRR